MLLLKVRLYSAGYTNQLKKTTLGSTQFLACCGQSQQDAFSHDRLCYEDCVILCSRILLWSKSLFITRVVAKSQLNFWYLATRDKSTYSWLPLEMQVIYLRFCS